MKSSGWRRGLTTVFGTERFCLSPHYIFPAAPARVCPTKVLEGFLGQEPGGSILGVAGQISGLPWGRRRGLCRS